jgi:DNA-directed RNA polymerase subunit beta'
LSTGSLVEQGMAVGIIAAQSIGEPGTQLTMRTFHIGGTAARAIEESEIRAKKAGIVQFTRLKVVRNDLGQQQVLTRNGEIVILDPRGRELEQYEVPAGAQLAVEENQEVAAGAVLCHWDPHSIPILAEVGGRIRYEDVIEGETMRIERDPSGHSRHLVMEHKGDLHPQIVIEDPEGKILDFYYLPEKAHIEVTEGNVISAGTLLAKTPRDVSGTQDITGGLPRVTEIFEARKPKDPAVIAEVDGTVELLGEKRRGKRTIIVRSETGIEREHLISHGKHLRVHAGEFVRAGEALVDGPLVPHDILRISGEEAVQQYLTREIQNVYRSQRVQIDDKHIEIIVAQMLRKVLVESIGDTGLLPGSVMDKFEFRQANADLDGCVKINDKGDGEFATGAIVPKETLEQVNAQIEALGGETAKGTRPQAATASTQLLGITKAAVQSSSFISAASFQETTKVLTEAALAGKVDNLVGLKENVILGHLVPAGTGFWTFQQSEVRIKRQALDILATATAPPPPPSFPLLEGAPEESGGSTMDLPPGKAFDGDRIPTDLDSLFGDPDDMPPERQ